MSENFTSVTELPGQKASKEQLSRLYNRYHFALQFCKDKDVLEAACGGGIGLGYLAHVAKRVIGGDMDKNILKYSLDHYRGRNKIELREFDAQNLPFKDKSFDVVILYEAIYYLSQPEKFVSEAHRVLKNNGILLVCTVNKDWADFNPSPHSIKYFSVPDLFSLFSQKFSRVELFGAFPVSKRGIKNKITSTIKRAAKALHLIPRTMKRKAKLKRIFFGKLINLPPELKEGIVKYSPPVQISNDFPTSQYKILFSVAFV